MSGTYDQMVSSIQFIQEDLKEAVNAAQTGEDFIRDGEELDPTVDIAQQPYVGINEPGREFSLLLAGGGPTILAIWHNGSGYLEATWGWRGNHGASGPGCGRLPLRIFLRGPGCK